MPRLGLVSSLTGGGAPQAEAVLVNATSILFDGTNDYVEVTGGDVDITDPLTLSAWVRLDTIPDGAPYDVMSNAQQWTLGGYRLEIKADGIINFAWKDSGKGYQSVTGDDKFDVDTWYHIAATKTGSTVNIYLNGSEESITTGSGYTGAISYNDLQIGIQKNDSSYRYPFDGYIDEVAIWDVYLSSADVASIYNSGVPNDLTSGGSYDTDRTSNLQGYWRFEENTGSTVADSSANSNAGTLTNSPAWSDVVPS